MLQRTMLHFNSALLTIASDFVGTYAPYQAISLQPAPEGGVFVAATDQGRVAFIAHDPKGQGDESICLLPSSELIKACKGIKTAERLVSLEGGLARVTTYRKTTSGETKEVPYTTTSTPFPPLPSIMGACLSRWGQVPALTATSGRYDSTYLERAIKSLADANQSLVMSCFDGGPLRLQSQDSSILVLVMPQSAEPIPPQPPWLSSYATSGG